MVKRYVINAVDKTEEEWFQTLLPHIAELLEMEYDSETHIMYVGEDNTTGFYFERGAGASSGNMFVYPRVNGTNVSNTSWTQLNGAFLNSYSYYLFYSKTTDGYVFNFSNSNNGEELGVGWCLKTSTNSNEDSICYFGRYKESFSSDGYYTNAHSGNLATPNSVSLCNYMTNDGLFYCKNLFHSVYFPSMQTHLLFTMNGKLFSSTPANGTTAVRFVVPLDESDW